MASISPQGLTRRAKAYSSAVLASHMPEFIVLHNAGGEISVNIQDIRYIVAIAEAGSISQAAERLLVAQPSLSKCIQKVEREYNVTLFMRTRGSSSRLTAEGEFFLEMAREILTSHDHFEDQIKRLRSRQKNNIVLGIPQHQSYLMVKPLLHELYHENSPYSIEIQIKTTPDLKQAIREGLVDMGVLSRAAHEEDHSIYYEEIFHSMLGVFLRTGSPAAKKAVRLEGYALPVLRMEDLADEPFVANVPGSSSRKLLEEVMERSGVFPPVIDHPNYPNRVMMVELGQANMMWYVNNLPPTTHTPKNQLYLLPPEQNFRVLACLACRPEFQSDPRFKLVLRCMRNAHKEQPI